MALWDDLRTITGDDDVATDAECAVIANFGEFYRKVLKPIRGEVEKVVKELPEWREVQEMFDEEERKVVDVVYETCLMVFRGCLDK